MEGTRSLGETATVTSSGKRPTGGYHGRDAMTPLPSLRKSGSTDSNSSNRGRDLLGKGRKKWWVKRSSSSGNLGSAGKRPPAVDEVQGTVIAANEFGAAVAEYSELAAEVLARQGSKESATVLAAKPKPATPQSNMIGKPAAEPTKGSVRQDSLQAKPDRRGPVLSEAARKAAEGIGHSLLMKAGSDAAQEQEADAPSQSPMKPISVATRPCLLMNPEDDANQEQKAGVVKRHTQAQSPEGSVSSEPKALLRIHSL